MEIKKYLRPLQFFVQRIIGIPYLMNEVEREINRLKDSNKAIFYYLNNYLLKAENLPPTSDPELRIMQLCDVQLMRIVAKILTKHNLTYWLDFGTLLGCVRHHGFIPWDDDMDISVPESQYNNILNVLQKELLQFSGFECADDPEYPMARIGVGFKHHSTGIWLDIFPSDCLPYSGDKKVYEVKLREGYQKFRDYYFKNKGKISSEKMLKIKDEYIPRDTSSSTFMHFVPPEWHMSRFNAYDEEDLYPLKELDFEGERFMCPKNSDKLLRLYYSNHYMELPQWGVLHHGEGRTPLSTWAKASGTDMDEVLKELQSIYEKL